MLFLNPTLYIIIIISHKLKPIIIIKVGKRYRSFLIELFYIYITFNISFWYSSTANLFY